jgi:hypothetical protein
MDVPMNFASFDLALTTSCVGTASETAARMSTRAAAVDNSLAIFNLFLPISG